MAVRTKRKKNVGSIVTYGRRRGEEKKEREEEKFMQGRGEREESGQHSAAPMTATLTAGARVGSENLEERGTDAPARNDVNHKCADMCKHRRRSFS